MNRDIQKLMSYREKLFAKWYKIHQQLMSIFTPKLEVVSSQNNVKVKLNISRIILKNTKLI